MHDLSAISGIACGSSAENIFIAEDNYTYSVKILRVKAILRDDGRARALEGAGGRH
jgi:hypothetical protein